MLWRLLVQLSGGLMHLIQANAQTTETVLRRIACTLAPELAKYKGYKAFGTQKKLCHMNLVQGLRTRQRLDDTLWLYGDGDNDIVWHSCLSDNANKCVVGAHYTTTGKDRWLGADGFALEIGVLDTMIHMPVRQWIFAYFNASPFNPK
jgi:hypothetical protein